MKESGARVLKHLVRLYPIAMSRKLPGEARLRIWRDWNHPCFSDMCISFLLLTVIGFQKYLRNYYLDIPSFWEIPRLPQLPAALEKLQGPWHSEC